MIVNFFREHPEYGSTSYPVRIGLLTKGRVVQFTKFVDGKKVPDEMRFGFVAGFGTNPNGELIIRVEVNDSFAFVHPGNLILH